MNRPGLEAVAYRAGTHAAFKRALLAALTDTARPELRDLRTREDDDFSIALLDAWATVADVLTFYQERIANESWLRTATERRSVLELARTIGYELHPGVAAGALLAFTLEDAVGAPARTDVPVGSRVQSLPGPGERPQSFETVEPLEARVELNALRARRTLAQPPQVGDRGLYLQGIATALRPGDGLLINRDFRHVLTVEPDAARGVTHVTWERGLEGAGADVFALRLRTSLWGAAAPDWRTFDDTIQGRYTSQKPTGDDWPGLTIEGISLDANVVHLAPQAPGVLPGSWLVLDGPGDTEAYEVKNVEESARKGFAISGKTTRVTLSGENLEHFDKQVREVAVYAQSERLALAETPWLDPVQGKEIELETPVGDIEHGRRLIVTDAVAGEAVELDFAEGAVLHLLAPLSRPYERATAIVLANVAAATHGEAVHEVLGGGDAAKPFLAFALRESPLTYTRADTPSGGVSTLDLRVDGVRWEEVPSLYAREPRERVYVARRQDDGTTVVEFGDGVEGARPATGTENVTAGYRKGIGREGNVNAGQLSLLMTRPLGVRSVTNPIAAGGGQDPQVLADARTNAPVTVLTLERVVSLRDFEDFARAFAGIAKALATWTWSADRRGVFLTVAGPDGDEVVAAVLAALKSALVQAGDPHVPVRVATCAAVPFRIAAVLETDPAYEAVVASVETALRAHFAFARRAFGQLVALSEVMAVIQDVPGVVSVDVERLSRGAASERKALLTASRPAPGAAMDLAAPAELLTLDLQPGDITA